MKRPHVCGRFVVVKGVLYRFKDSCCKRCFVQVYRTHVELLEKTSTAEDGESEHPRLWKIPWSILEICAGTIWKCATKLRFSEEQKSL